MFVVAALAEAESAEEDEERQPSVQEHGLSWAGQEWWRSQGHLVTFLSLDITVTKGLP